MNKVYKILTVLLLTFTMFLTAGENQPTFAKKSKKTSWSTKVARKIKRSIKKTARKTKRAFVKAGCEVTNAVMDSAIKIKSKITGKKPKKTWVKGHYKKGNKRHTKGHFRKIRKKGKKSSGYSGVTATSGQPLPSQDPLEPNF